MSTTKYRPEIDGLRAFAVIPVVFFHMSAGWMPGGFIGVDVFFVISGFLITRLILADCDQGAFELSQFWLRRVRRILPAVMTMVVVTSLVAFFTLYSTEVNDLGRQGVATLVSFANIHFWRLAGNYWGAQAESSLFLHTWSLSVEEQFYLFFPFLMVLLTKYFRRWLLHSVAALVSISFLFFLYGATHNPTSTFYLLPTRAWELGSGCLLAILTNDGFFRSTGFWRSGSNRVLSSLGLMAILVSYLLISGESGLSAYMAIPVLGTVFVIAFTGNKQSIVYKVLTAPPIIYIGKISYSLYLWHWPVLFLSKSPDVGGHALIAPIYAIMLMLVMAILSYHLIEQKTRRNPKVLKPIIVSFVAAVIFSAFMTTTSEDISAFSDTTWRGHLYNTAPDRELLDVVRVRMKGIIAPTPDVIDRDSYATGGVLNLYGGESPEVVLLGDSHALMWAGLLDDVAKELGSSISFYAAEGTPTFFEIPVEASDGGPFFTDEEKYEFDEMRLHFLEKWKPKVVLISVRWGSLKSIAETQDLMEFLGGLGSKVLLIEQPPEAFGTDKNAPQYLSFIDVLPEAGANRYLPKPSHEKYEHGQRIIRRIAKLHPHCDVIPIADLLMSEDEVWVLDGPDVLYIDDDHMSYNGTLKAKARITQSIQSRL